MSKHDFTVRVEVDDAALAELLEERERSHRGLLLDPDPSEWSFEELADVVGAEAATAEIQGYEALSA